jgi:hypothetical protein
MSLDLEHTTLLEHHDARPGNSNSQGLVEDIYCRFNPRQKRSILSLVAFSGLITSRMFYGFRALDC